MNMNSMFKEAPSFNSDISKWDVSRVTYMGGMFRRATSFNRWDIAHALTHPPTHSLTHQLTYTFTHSLTHLITH